MLVYFFFFLFLCFNIKNLPKWVISEPSNFHDYESDGKIGNIAMFFSPLSTMSGDVRKYASTQTDPGCGRNKRNYMADILFSEQGGRNGARSTSSNSVLLLASQISWLGV